MPKNNTFKNDILKLIFNGSAIVDLAANASSPITSLIMALHIADPGADGLQTTSELSYTGYLRQAVPRNSSGWIVSGNVVKPVDDIPFPIMSGGTGGIVTHISIGTGNSDKILYRGAITPNLVVVTTKQPIVTNDSTLQED